MWCADAVLVTRAHVSSGVEGVHVDLPVGARDAQVPLCGARRGAEARDAAHRTAKPGGDAARAARRQEPAARRGAGHRDAAGEVRRLRTQEGRAAVEDGRVPGPAAARRQGAWVTGEGTARSSWFTWC